MDTLTKQVRRAQRRLTFQRFIVALGWAWCAALVVALLLIVADKRHWLDLEPWIAVAGCLVVGLAGALIWTVVRSGSPVDAAIEIDRRFDLRERISSALAMSPEERETEAGQALLEDAVRRADRIDVPERFRVKPPRQLLLPILPAVVALAVVLLVKEAVVETPAEAAVDPATVQKAVKKAGSVLAQKLQEQRKEAQKQDLKEAERLFDKLERETKSLTDKTTGDKTKTLIQLNDLSKELEKRREKLEGTDGVKNHLRQLKKLSDGPAEEFAKAVSRGDFKQAMQELDKLKEQLANGDLNEQQREELANQLNEMKDKLQQMADAQAQMQKDLQKQIDNARAANNAQEASKLEEQLDKLMQQGPQMDKLKDLAQQMGQCTKCMKDGQLQDAAAKLGQLQQSLQQMDQQLQEMEMLDQAMDQVAQMRNQIGCPNCGGKGCKECQGQGMGMGQGQGDDPNGKPGNGLGRGRGMGFRPEEKTDYTTRDSHAPQKIGRGSATVVDMVNGPNIKGNTDLQVKEALEAAERAESDPLTSQKMPRKHRQQVREYFDKFQQPNN